MYTIGQFAVITQVSAKALRHYDEIDLFKPYTIVAENNYRYYHKQQIAELNTIKELKSYGFSLQQIKKIMASKSGLNNDLKHQLIVIEKEIKDLQHKQNLINQKLNNNKQNTAVENQNYLIEKHSLKSYQAICVQDTIRLNDIGQLISRLYELAKEYNVQVINGHKMRVKYLDNDLCSIEVFAEVIDLKSLPINNIVEIEQGTYVSTVHNGIKHKENAYAKLYDYANKQHLKLADNPLEEISIILGKLNTKIYIRIIE